MASTYKTHYANLPQWTLDDKPAMQDYNEAFLAIDGKLQQSHDTLQAVEAALPKKPDISTGVWTPEFGAHKQAPPTFTYTERTGSYTRIGNLVFIRFRMAATYTGGDPEDYLTITGVPFLPEGMNTGSLAPVGPFPPAKNYVPALCMDPNGKLFIYIVNEAQKHWAMFQDLGRMLHYQGTMTYWTTQ